MADGDSLREDGLSLVYSWQPTGLKLGAAISVSAYFRVTRTGIEV